MKEKKNLKILLAAPPFLPIGENISYGGSERVILGLYKALLKQGHGCFVAGTSDSELKNIIPTIPSIGTNDLYHSTIPLDVSRENTYQKMKHVAKVLEIATKGDFDIVHCHDDYFIPFFPLFNKPVLTTIHCCSYEEFWDDKKNQDLVKEKPALVVLSEIQKSISLSPDFIKTQAREFIMSIFRQGYSIQISFIAQFCKRNSLLRGAL